MVVGKCGISPSYFLDEMTDIEAKAVLDGYYEKYKDEWEQTRYISFVIAATQSSKIKKPTDILKFDWDEKTDKTTKEEALKREKEMLELRERSTNLIEFNSRLA